MIIRLKNKCKMENHTLSIITVTYNSEKFLEQTIRSVIDQTYTNIEFIIIDGASSDGTLDIIRKYQSKIAFWQSEPDSGIADAMNKGLKYASGEFVLFLNSDDYLVDDSAIDSIMPQVKGPYDIFVFRIYFLINGVKKLAEKLKYNWRINFKSSVYHQATLCRRSLFERIGQFDTSFSIAMDYDFFLRAYRKAIKAKIVNTSFSVMRKDGVSSQTDWQSLQERFRQEERVQKINTKPGLMNFVSWLFWRLYFSYRFLRHVVGV